MKKINNRHEHSKITKRTIKIRFHNLYKIMKKEKITTKENAKEIRDRLISIFSKNHEIYKNISDIYHKEIDIFDMFEMVKNRSVSNEYKIIMHSDDISFTNKSGNISSQSWLIVQDEKNNLIIYFANY